MSVPLTRGPSLAAGSPTALFEGNYATPGTGKVYDVSPDGTRFLMIKNVDAEGAAPQIVVVQNWIEELKRLVPTQ